MKMNKIVVSLMAAGIMASPLAHATNGMDLAGYGPVAEAMGGASMAYDNGVAAVMNNPATLGMMPEDSSRVDVALGVLAPSVTSKCDASPCNLSPAAGASVDSSATAFYMPAMGYAKKSGRLTYGVGVFSQGGMGTEYASNSFLAAGTGDKVRSEVGVGRFIVPMTYDVNDKLTIGGSLDFVWAGMDLKMALPGASFMDMMPAAMGGTQTFGSVSGSMLTPVGPLVSSGACVAGGGTATDNCINSARVDFSNDSAFTGQAKGNGGAFKLGGTYKVNSQLTLGATYHSKTSISDLNAPGATMSMSITNSTAFSTAPGFTATVPVSGSVSVHNFQWPETMAVGGAYLVSDKLLLVADYKHIGWKNVMKNFSMTFTADNSASNQAYGVNGTSVDMTLFQNWDDQNVFELGGAYKTTDALTLRAGLNVANNPIPDKYMNPLFPAIAKSHVSLGAGYVVNKASSVDFSYMYVPKTSATGGSGVTVDFGGYSMQVMYSYKY